MPPKPFFIARGIAECNFLPQMANRHGLVAGATGTGKTITLRVLAENFSTLGVPVFLADVKGDLAFLKGKERTILVEGSELFGAYERTFDRESAFEILTGKPPPLAAPKPTTRDREAGPPGHLVIV